ncbi:MAG: hypothetical protein HOP16_01320 [Acidobacteria bacterium]|nr:hypothetical protein [Acidobacteriota bacterium]
MLYRVMMLTAGLVAAALLAPAEGVAQNTSPGKWSPQVAIRGQDAVKERKPAPRRNINGMWNAQRLGNQSGGVQLKPNNGRPENALPYTPYGLELYKKHKPLEGLDSVSPAFNNDPRTKCEPLGFPRWNHYDVGVQIFQDEHKIAMLYNYDNRWRLIWTDGRSLPTVVDGGVEADGEFRDTRWFGYSVGKWLDDYTLEVVTVGIMPDDRAWLDNTGRPISEQARITERFRRIDSETLEWSETIDDPKIYTRPWETMKLPMTLQDSGIDQITRYCSPSEIERYNTTFGDAASGK